MFRQMQVCKLMISCPSDVRMEIEIINRVVENINDSLGISMDLFVKTLHWSKNLTPKTGDSAQSSINKQILDKADAIIAIFGNKIGTATQKYDSGTIEEIEEMIQKKKQVFVYFSDKPMRKSEINMNEEQKIRKFKNKYKNKGIYVEYCSDEEFYESVTRNLTRYLMEEVNCEVNSIGGKTRFDDFISEHEEIDLIYDYNRFSKIKSVVSNANVKCMTLSTYKNCFDVNIDITNAKVTDTQEFAMAMLEYVPCDNWSVFCKADYCLEFDVVGEGGIKAFQLEIKSDARNKILDERIKVHEKEEHYQIHLSQITRDISMWEKVSQVCFTVFFTDDYMLEKQGTISIKNLKMSPK